MRSLIRIIIQYHFVLLFIILEIITLSIYINGNESHKQKVINSSNLVFGGLYNLSSKLYVYFNLKEINEQLAKENVELHNQLKKTYKDNSINLLDLFDSVYTKKYHFIPSRVINNSINKQHNYLTIDKGWRQGIKPEMGVVSASGVVGIISNVSKNYSTVISLLNTKLSISAKIKRNEYFGSLKWKGTDYKTMVLSEIPNHVIQRINDTIVTSGYSLIFPEGLLLGTISEIDENKQGNFVDTEIKLSTDFKNITYVYVIENYQRDEQIKIEQSND